MNWPLTLLQETFLQPVFVMDATRIRFSVFNQFLPSGFRPKETRPASFLNGFKNIPGKACVKRVHNSDAFVNFGNKDTRKPLNIAY